MLLDQLVVRLGLGRDEAIRLGHADDVHDFIVRADNVAVDSLRLRIDRAAALVVLLGWFARVGVAIAQYEDVVRGAALGGGQWG